MLDELHKILSRDEKAEAEVATAAAEVAAAAEAVELAAKKKRDKEKEVDPLINREVEVQFSGMGTFKGTVKKKLRGKDM
jgi:hypothetical protein